MSEPITLASIKTEWIAFLLTFTAIVLNKKWDLGLTLEQIVALAGTSIGYAASRTAAKRVGA
jgi:hypothetical protein